MIGSPCECFMRSSPSIIAQPADSRSESEDNDDYDDGDDDDADD